MRLVALILAASLNPLVVRAPEAIGPVPADCRVSGAVAPARVPEAAPEEALPLPPVKPVNGKSAARDIDEAKRALANNDRAAFDAALARAKAAGGATRVYEDIARIWDAQFESPFFGRDSEAYRIASGYPGWEPAVRRQVFTDERGVKFYPAAETRMFLARGAGVTKSAPAAGRREARSSGRSSATSGSAHRRSKAHGTRKTATAVSPGRSAPQVAAAPARPVPRPVSPSSPPAPRELPGAAPNAPSSTAAPISDAATSTAPVSDTAASATTSTTGSAAPVEVPAAPATVPAAVPAAVPAQPERRSLILPAILILIGIGVLSLLFRTAR